jgi:hypothetical protein
LVRRDLRELDDGRGARAGTSGRSARYPSSAPAEFSTMTLSRRGWPRPDARRGDGDARRHREGWEYPRRMRPPRRRRVCGVKRANYVNLSECHDKATNQSHWNQRVLQVLSCTL